MTAIDKLCHYIGIASLLGRSGQAVRNRALVLGLTKREAALWYLGAR